MQTFNISKPIYFFFENIIQKGTYLWAEIELNIVDVSLHSQLLFRPISLILCACYVHTISCIIPIAEILLPTEDKKEKML